MVDFEHFSRLVHEIYHATVDPNRWSVALEKISAAVGTTGCAVVTTEPRRTEITVRSSGADPASVTEYNEYFGRLDPTPAALDKVPTGLVLPSPEVVDRDVLVRSEFYNDWADPYEYGDGAHAVLSRGDNGTTWLCAAAKVRPERFGTSEQMSLLRAIVPHLQTAITVQGRLSEFERHQRGLVATLDALTDGVAVVGRDGRVLRLNSAAEAIVARGDGLCVCSGRLHASAPHVDGLLDRMVHRALDGAVEEPVTGGCVSVSRPAGRRSYLVRAIPLIDDTPEEPPSTALVVIVDPDVSPAPDSDVLRHMYGLTRAEAEVALRVLDGKGLMPIAEELGVSLTTVRTHLQHVFDKTGTHRQAELVRLLLRALTATRRIAGRSHSFG